MLDDTISGASGAGALRRDSSYEEGLIERARRLESTDWTELYEQNYEKIYRYVYLRVGVQQTAEDLTASTFVEALKSIGSYEQRGRPILAWLYRIARNVVSYHYRRMARSGPPPSPLGRNEAAEAAAVTDESQDPANQVEGLDVRQAIHGLAPDQRDAIILRYYVGMTAPEAASVMGKSERAVYSLQARAIKALKRLLESR